MYNRQKHSFRSAFADFFVVFLEKGKLFALKVNFSIFF